MQGIILMQGVIEEDGYVHFRMSLFSVYPAKQFYRVKHFREIRVHYHVPSLKEATFDSLSNLSNPLLRKIFCK